MRRLIKLPEGVTATRGARIALTILADLGSPVTLKPGRYQCRAVGWAAQAWADAGAWCWWLEGPGGDQICGSQWPTAELWTAHKVGETWVDVSMHRDVSLGAAGKVKKSA